MLATSEPPGYRRTAEIKRPRLDASGDQIDQWLTENKVRPPKQRHTAKRIFERLRTSCLMIGQRTGLSRNTIKNYLREGAVEPKLKTPNRPGKLDPYADR